jgi:FtsH-binding integral membrane protein
MEKAVAGRQGIEVIVNEFVRSVYNWMAIGLALTGFVAYYVSGRPDVVRLIFGNAVLMIVFILAYFGLVMYLSARIDKISSGTATFLFLLYSGLTGVLLSSVFLVYTTESISSTFFICAGTFVGCSIYGWTTKRDLTSWSGFLMMGLIGVVIAILVNMFIQSSAMNMIIGCIGVIVFVGLTAYDTQKLKNMALTQPAGLEGGVKRKGAILGALSLYLDFINLFLMLLRIFGQRR